jgi:hypothetical protein
MSCSKGGRSQLSYTVQVGVKSIRQLCMHCSECMHIITCMFRIRILVEGLFPPRTYSRHHVQNSRVVQHWSHTVSGIDVQHKCESFCKKNRIVNTLNPEKCSQMSYIIIYVIKLHEGDRARRETRRSSQHAHTRTDNVLLSYVHVVPFCFQSVNIIAFSHVIVYGMYKLRFYVVLIWPDLCWRAWWRHTCRKWRCIPCDVCVTLRFWCLVMYQHKITRVERVTLVCTTTYVSYYGRNHILRFFGFIKYCSKYHFVYVY